MVDIARFTQIFIACLLAAVLAMGTARADNDTMTNQQAMSECAKDHKISGEKHSPQQTSHQTHCCSPGHCWVAAEISAPLFAVAVTGSRVDDLTNLMTVSPASTRLERPPQTI